jgi:hypothetical protein
MHNLVCWNPHGNEDKAHKKIVILIIVNIIILISQDFRKTTMPKNCPLSIFTCLQSLEKLQDVQFFGIITLLLTLCSC